MRAFRVCAVAGTDLDKHCGWAAEDTEPNVPLKLMSATFRQGADILKKYSCDGDNLTPFARSASAKARAALSLWAMIPTDFPKYSTTGPLSMFADGRGPREAHGAEGLTDRFHRATLGLTMPAPAHRTATIAIAFG